MGKGPPEALGDQRSIDQLPRWSGILDRVERADDTERSGKALDGVEFPEPACAPNDLGPLPARQAVDEAAKSIPIPRAGRNARARIQHQQRGFEALRCARQPVEAGLQRLSVAKGSCCVLPDRIRNAQGQLEAIRKARSPLQHRPRLR